MSQRYLGQALARRIRLVLMGLGAGDVNVVANAEATEQDPTVRVEITYIGEGDEGVEAILAALAELGWSAGEMEVTSSSFAFTLYASAGIVRHALEDPTVFLGTQILADPRAVEADESYMGRALMAATAKIHEEAEAKNLILTAAPFAYPPAYLERVTMGQRDEEGNPVKTLVSCLPERANVVMLAYEAPALPPGKIPLIGQEAAL